MIRVGKKLGLGGMRLIAVKRMKAKHERPVEL
jgi:hypothetical protein